MTSNFYERFAFYKVLGSAKDAGRNFAVPRGEMMMVQGVGNYNKSP